MTSRALSAVDSGTTSGTGSGIASHAGKKWEADVARDTSKRYRVYRDTETGDGKGWMIFDLETGDVVRRYKREEDYDKASRTEIALNSGKRKR